VKLPEFKKPDLSRGRLKAGPELRVPDFLADLYYDLRDRRLLPLVALLVVAIVAAPILIGGSTKDDAVPPVASGAGPTGDQASFSVVPAAEELQAYKKRLGHRRTVNPFNPWSATKHRTPSNRELREAEALESGGGSTAVPAPEPETATTTTGGGSPPEYTPEEPAPTTTTTVIEKQPKVVKATLKAQVGVAAMLKVGFNGKGLQEVEVEDQARLPQPENTAIVYNGYSKKKNPGALFLMTSQVSEFSGEGHCALGGATCQLIELKVGQSETFGIGYGESKYTVKLLGFEPIVKEEVIESEGRKVRVPDHRGGKSGNEGKANTKGAGSEEPAGTEPSPRLLLR
jgi:hypothetical protein